MKTLKKTLGVVLALAMVLGMVAMAFTASAANVTVGHLAEANSKTSVKAGDDITINFIADVDLKGFTGYLKVEPAGAATIKGAASTTIVSADFSSVTLPTAADAGDHACAEFLMHGGTFQAKTKTMFTVTLTVADFTGETLTVSLDTADCEVSVINDYSVSHSAATVYSGADGDRGTVTAISFAKEIATTKVEFGTGTDKTLVLGGTETYTDTATRTPAASNDDTAIAYTSSDPTVATVGATDGLVTALKDGKTTITAEFAGKTDTYTVTVKTAAKTDGSEVDITGLGEEVAPTDSGATHVIAKNGKFTAVSVADLVKQAATGKATQFEVTAEAVTNEGVIELAADGKSFTGLKAGTATIKITVKATGTDGTLTALATTYLVDVTVAEVYATDATTSALTADKTALTVGETAQLIAPVADATVTNSTIKDGTEKYETSNDSIITVDGTGLVTAVAKGTATITYTAENANGDTITKTLEFTVAEVEDQGKNPENKPSTQDGKNDDNQGSTNTGDAGVALAVTLSLAAGAAFVFAKKKRG